ncbi:MAG: SIR2 family protein, partial [Nitrospirae bacterium]|nr:SIR2 family protein [Nitrospirota bacterium]
MQCKDWNDYKTTNALNLQALKEVVKTGYAIAFIGAGCSIPLGYPSWAGLIRKMLDEIVTTRPSAKSLVEMLMDEKDLLYAAGECKGLMGPEYYPFMGREFAPKTPKTHTEEHKIVIELPFNNYITSNYDPCLDNAYCAIEGKPPLCLTHKNTQMLAEFYALTDKPQKKVFHIHGRHNAPQDIVLTEENYRDNYNEDFISLLRSIIMTRPVVFIGSGVNDMDFLATMRFIANLFKGFQKKHYAIIPCLENVYAEYEAERLAETYNIVPVFYENPDDKHTEREVILRDILSYCNDTTGKKLPDVKISVTSKDKALEQYKLKLNVELANLRILNMNRPLNLSDVYIKISLLENKITYVKDSDAKYGKMHGNSAAPEDMDISWLKTEQPAKSMSIEDALGDDKYKRRIVILGDPGAGKTTLLKHITLQLADNGVKGIEVIPIFVTLRDYINRFTPDLLEYLDGDLSRRYGFNHAGKYLEEEFERGNVAIFFDGLDEISGKTQEEVGANYKKVVDVIGNIATRFSKCYIAVTCRKAGWKGGIHESFSIFEVLDFTTGDITSFVDKWFRDEPEKARELNSKLGKRTRVKSLAKNPLLLSFVCILYGSLGTLPEKRVTLYEECVKVLLKDWDETRGIERRSIIDQDEKKLLLQYIAYRFFIAGERYFKEDDLISAIRDCLSDLCLKSKDAADILREISANHGLLKEQAKGWYGFIHLTVQEYFAACEMFDRRDYNTAIERSFKPWWEEVVLLLAGIRDSTELIVGLFEKPDDIFDHNLILAGKCFAERPTLRGGGKLRETVLNKLKDVVSKGKYEVNKYEAVDVLAENGNFDFLLYVLRDDKTDNDVRGRIADALGNIGDVSIVAGLM